LAETHSDTSLQPFPPYDFT